MKNTYAYESPHNRELMRIAMNAPMLEREHELNLARKWRDEGDKKALDEIIQSYLRLVVSTASKFRAYGLPASDLVQEGVVGLMEAAARFDPDRNIRFSTYASWWVKSAMQDFVLRNWSIVRTGTTAAHKTLFFNLRRLRARMKTTMEGGLSTENRANIAKDLGVNLRDVEHMETRVFGGDHSLNATVAGENETEWLDFLTANEPLPEENVIESRDGAMRDQLLGNAMSTLSDREVIIIKGRLLSEKADTLATLGQKLGISKERVRQIEAQALGKLRVHIEDEVGDPREAGFLPSH